MLRRWARGPGVSCFEEQLWASVRVGHLEKWFRSWVLDSVYSAGVGAVQLRLGFLLRSIQKRFVRRSWR